MADDLNQTNLIPQRNPGLIQRIAGAVFRSTPQTGPQPEQQETTQSGVVGSVFGKAWEDYFKSTTARQTIYDDVDEMDDTSEEASSALDIIADNATSSEDGSMSSFLVKSDDSSIQVILDDVNHVAKLYETVYTRARSALKYGDYFGEIIVNAEGRVVDVRTLYPKSMYRNEDEQGNLRMGEPRYDENGVCLNRPGECAFEQRDPSTDRMIAAFWPWQIVHARWNWDGISKYGRSYLRVSRLIWKKLKAEEEGLIIGRLTRAMLKLAFYVDTTGLSKEQKESALREFRANVTRRDRQDGRRENPFTVMTDLFMTAEHYKVGGQVVESRTNVSSIDPKNEGLTNINDVEHFHRKLLSTLRVPPAYLTFEKDVNAKSTVTMQDVQFIRMLRRLQQFLAHMYRQVYDTALILAGKDPQPDSYTIEWPPLSTNDAAASADAMFKMAQAAGILLGTSSLNQTPIITIQWVMRHILNMDDEDIEEQTEALQQLADQKAQQEQEQLQAQQQQQKTNASDIHNPADPEEMPEKVAQGSNTAVRQEAANVAELLIRQQVGPDFTRVVDGQKRVLQETEKTLAALNKNGKNP